MTNQPVVSFVIPVYDRTELLRRTLTSLFAQETEFSYEIIVVQDGSPDTTRNLVRSMEYDSPAPFRSFSFSRSSGTASRGRNLGVLEARGDFVAFSDSDDVSLPMRLQTSVEGIRRESVDLVAGRVRYVQDGSRPMTIEPGATSEWVPLTEGVLLTVNPVVPSTVTVRRETLLSHGGFRTSMRYREDHELWLRLAHRGCRLSMLDSVLADYLIHDGNNELVFIDQDDRWHREMLSVYKRPFARVDWNGTEPEA